MRPHGKVDRFHQCQTANSDDGIAANGCARKELEPQQLFIDLSLLICEARQPELSERGRVPSPHCPQPLGSTGTADGGQQSVAGAAAKSSVDGFQNRHLCDETNEKCKRARQIETELRQLWTRGIPACLTVLLLSDECSKQDNCMAEALILEKWTIQQLERRNRDDKLLPGQFLLQAVRSHLHFSQLSAWLIASKGKSPTNVVYRVCLPGELESTLSTTSSASSSDLSLLSPVSSVNLEKHQFPLCAAGKNMSLNVTVESLPRCEMVPSRSCLCLRPSTSGILAGSEASKSADLSTSTFNPTASSSQPATDSLKCTRSQRVDSVAEEKEPCVSRPIPNFPESGSYHSLFDDESETPPRSTEWTRRQQLSFVPVSLPSLVSKTSMPPDRHEERGISATNPLFDVAAPPVQFANKYHLQSRVDALRTEAGLLSAKLRTLNSNSTSSGGNNSVNSGTGANSKFSVLSPNYNHKSSGKPLFFLADDENDSEDDVGARSSKSEAPDEENLRDSKSARRILFADEKALLANDQGTFSEWISQTAHGISDVSVSGTEVDIGSVEDTEESLQETDGCRGVTRHQSFNDRQSKERNEAVASTSKVGYGRKSKRVPTLSTFGPGVQFHPKTGLPLSSSPAPLKRNHNSFAYDPYITSVSTLKSALYYYDHESGGSSDSDSGWPLCKSAPASTNLLGSFEESALNGRIKPYGSVDGFTLELGASGAFCPTHVTLNVTTLFFNVSDDNAPSPYFGLCSLENIGRRGYHVPKKGSVQATLFNPQGTVVKMFVVRYDLCDMPPSCQTFVRQRTFFMPSSATLRDAMENRSWLRYLIHLRFTSSSSGKLFLHTDIRMLFSRKSELEAYNFKCVDGVMGESKTMDTFELRSFTEMPKDPKFSPRKFSRSDKERDK